MSLAAYRMFRRVPLKKLLFNHEPVRRIHVDQILLTTNLRKVVTIDESLGHPYRKRPPSVKDLGEDVLMIKRVLARKTPIEQLNWDELRDNVKKYTVENVVDSTFIDICAPLECADLFGIEVAMKYVQYLKTKTPELPLAVQSKYLRLFYLKASHAELTEDEKKEIFDIYEKIIKKYPLMEDTTLTNCILALSKTSRWEDCYELLKKYEESNSTPHILTIYQLATAAFANGNIEKGFETAKLASDSMPDNNFSHNIASKFYEDYVMYCRKHCKTVESLREHIERLFQWWKDCNVIISKRVLDNIMDSMEIAGFDAKYSIVNTQGVCNKCYERLAGLQMTPEEFNILAKEIMEKGIIDRNIYQSTWPGELKRFKEYLSYIPPYDIVVDGLNVSYLSHHNLGANASALKNCVSQFKMMDKRLLVIGRKHMRKWPRRDMEYIERRSSLFLVDNLSKDDPFLLYATILGGDGTMFVSNDMMRQTRAKLHPDVRPLFDRWRLKHQYVRTTTKGRDLQFRLPWLYSKFTQRNSNGWHIPYNDSEEKFEHYEHNVLWLCVKRRDAKKQ